MPTFQESVDLQTRECLGSQIRSDQGLVASLETQLLDLKGKELAAREIIALTKDRVEDQADHQRATATLPRIARRQAELQARMDGAKHRIGVNEKRSATLNPGDMAHTLKIQSLFQKLSGVLG